MYLELRLYLSVMKWLFFQCDIEGVYVDGDKLSKFCKDHSFIGWFPTSAKTDVNIGKRNNINII